MRRSLIALGAIALALGMGGCSEALSEPMDAKELAAAVSEQVAEEEWVTHDFTLDAAGQKLTGAGTGHYGGGKMQSQVKLDYGGQQTEIRYIGEDTYVSVPEYLRQMVGKDKEWLNLNGDDQAAQMLAILDQIAEQGIPTELMDRIDEAGVVTSADSVELDGKAATEYGLDMRVEKLDQLPLGLGSENHGQLADIGVKTYEVRLWVDDGNLPLKAVMDVSQLYSAIKNASGRRPETTDQPEELAATVTVTYTGWGEPVDIKAPPNKRIGKVKMPTAATKGRKARSPKAAAKGGEK